VGARVLGAATGTAETGTGETGTGETGAAGWGELWGRARRAGGGRCNEAKAMVRSPRAARWPDPARPVVDSERLSITSREPT